MRGVLSLNAVVAGLLAAGQAAAQSTLSINSPADIKNTAATVARDLLSFYNGTQPGETPGILPGPPPSGDYYWYSAGIMWQTLINYWYYTGDSKYNDVVMQALMWQRGENSDFLPLNQTLSIGNDDQGYWATAAMVAAERGFPDPPANTNVTWVSMVERVFNQYVARYDTKTCNGGLRWQLSPTSVGYNYKDAGSNGLFFSLSARLARYTGNKTYADWADKTWDWVERSGYVDKESYAVYDGANVANNCTDINRVQFSANNALYLLGASYMYNYTNGDTKWQTRANGLIKNGLATFFPNDVAFEVSCEKQKKCNSGMKFFKGLLHQWWTASTQVAPFTAQTVLPVLKKSATAAVKQCTGQKNGTNGGQFCGLSWAEGTFDGETGAGEQMSVLAAVSGLLVGDKAGPSTAKSGNTSGGGQKTENGTDKKNAAAGNASGGVLSMVTVSVGMGLLTTLAL